jgi:hypothetical protein
VHIRVRDELPPPYQVAVVELDEGPRLLARLVGEPARITDCVTVSWEPRAGLPPLPIFRRVAGGDGRLAAPIATEEGVGGRV